MYDDLKESDKRSASDHGCGPVLSAIGPDQTSLRQQVFEHVRASGRAARSDITRALGISAGSATTITADLIATGLLQEVEGLPRESGRGRPPVALEVVKESHFVIGIKLADAVHSAVLTDFAGNVLAETTLRASTGRKPLAALLDEMDTLLADVLMATGKTMSDISAVGVGLSGVIDYQTGAVAWSPLLELRNSDLREAFHARHQCPIHIDNDANVLTLAELWFGAGRHMSNFAVVTVEHGVGMGLVLDNRLFRGSRGMGLELGHTKVQLDGALCRCGQRGCLEAYLADYALAREATTALDQQNQDLQTPHAVLSDLYNAAKAGDHAAAAIFKRAGRFLSVGLSNVVQLFDPQLIILSGERMRYDYLYADSVMEEAQTLTLTDGSAPCPVEIHTWGDMVWARGAGALALSAATDAVLGDLRA